MSALIRQFHNYKIYDIHQNKTPEIRAAIIEFWQRNRILPPGVDPAQRVDQVVLVSIHESGHIAGVTTVYQEDLRHIGCDDSFGKKYYFYRMFIQPRDRVPRMMDFMLKMTFDVLQSIKMPDKPEGLIVVFENRKASRRGVRRVIEKLGFIQIATDPRGNACYMRDFS